MRMLFVAALLTVMMAGTVSAEIIILRDDAPPSPCGSIDANTPCYAAGPNGTYIQCTAKSTQRCQEQAEDPVTGRKLCVSVTHDGGCQCNATTKVVSGLCQYYK